MRHVKKRTGLVNSDIQILHVDCRAWTVTNVRLCAFIVYSRVFRLTVDRLTCSKRIILMRLTRLLKTEISCAMRLAFSYANKEIFYSDIQKGSINSVFSNGTNPLF
uniref:Uncharacterized protein n=1 Tax=Strigamia maritima TaxID=126957 RepID=T1J2I3_STRMM